jgi:hypothetical protein
LIAVALALCPAGANLPTPRWEYIKWEGRTEIKCWRNHVERVAGGTDALQFQAGLTEEDSVYVFVPELFRKAKLNVTGTVRFACIWQCTLSMKLYMTRIRQVACQGTYHACVLRSRLVRPKCLHVRFIAQQSG